MSSKHGDIAKVPENIRTAYQAFLLFDEAAGRDEWDEIAYNDLWEALKAAKWNIGDGVGIVAYEVTSDE